MSSSCLGSWRWPASSHLARGTPVPQPEEQREFVLRPRGALRQGRQQRQPFPHMDITTGCDLVGCPDRTT